MTKYKKEFIEAWVADNKLGKCLILQEGNSKFYNLSINHKHICQTDLNDWESLDIGLNNNLSFCEDEIERIKALHYFEFGEYPKEVIAFENCNQNFDNLTSSTAVFDEKLGFFIFRQTFN